MRELKVETKRKTQLLDVTDEVRALVAVAIAYLVITYETLGPDWMTPDRLRLGASTLLNDVLMQIDKERTGSYQSPDYFTVD